MIDWSRVADLERDFGDDDFAEVLDLFVEETDEVVARIAEGRSADLDADLHFVKGSAENMGMAELAALCRSGEVDIAAGREPDLGGIGAIYRASCEELRSREAV